MEQPTVEQESFELLPPEGDGKLGLSVCQLLGEVIADKVRRGLHEKWLDHYRLSKNQPWRREVKNVPTLSANLLLTHRQRIVNTLTDNEPTFNLAQVGSVAEEQETALTKIKRAAEHWWREQEQQSIFASSVDRGEMYGCAVEKVWFDPDLELGIGEVRTENVDPFHFGLYPTTCMRLQDAEAVLHFYPMATRKVKQLWPEMAEQVKPDGEILKDLGEERQEVSAGKQMENSGVLQRTFGWFASLFGSEGQDSKSVDERTLVIECWVRDWSRDGESLKYPGGIRRVTVCSAGQVVLEDKPNPSINPELGEAAQDCYLWDKFPFSLTNSIEDHVSVWGMSDYEQLEGLQREYSKVLSQISYFRDKAVRPKVINPKDSGVSNEEFTNTYGILNPSSTAMAQGIRYLEMSHPGLVNELQGNLQVVKDLFFLVAGTFEMEQAQTGGRSVIAYKAIAALLEHAATMMRGKIRNYQRLIRERGRMWTSLAQNFYTEERWISYEDDGEEQTETITGIEMLVPARLTVVSGSTLPRAEIARREEALELFKAGAIDDKELLRSLDWPNRSEVLRRKEEGLLGPVFQRMSQLGLPQEILQIMQETSQMDDKEFQKAMESGSLPQLGMETPDDPMTQADLSVKNAELEVKQAEAEKVRAERLLIEEKAVTEGARQRQILAGIRFDAEQLAQKSKEVSMKDNRPGYNEQGMASNNLTEENE